MLPSFFRKHELKISRIAIVIVFLALIRLIGECFRLQDYASYELTFSQLRPYLTGAFITAVSCFAMTILSFYSQSRIIILLAILTIASLVAIKIHYKLP